MAVVATALLAGFLGQADVAEGAAAETIAILPADIALRGADAAQRVLVLRMVNGEYAGPAADEVKLTSSDEKVCRVRDGAVVPTGDGRATLTATLGERRATAEVVVEQFAALPVWSFRNHVEPVLARAGCNSGACHGALAGKGGLKLSLRGYDTERDFRTITRQARGRRIELADPGRSLLLAKPSGALPHKGGVRLDVDSDDYVAVANWIAAGAPPPTAADPRLERIEVVPERSLLEQGAAQPLLVVAHYSDGRRTDVTRWARFTATDARVATVDDEGVVRVVGHGEGAVTAWFASRIVVARVTAPYSHELPAETFAAAPRRNFIDAQVLTQLERLRIPPSPRAGDAEFLRRAYLDTIGLLPTAAEARAFLADRGADKRDRLIESLLVREEFVDYWTYKWSDLLLINGNLLRPQAVKAYHTWLRGHVKQGTPWDVLVREVVTASGSSVDQGATNFYALHQSPEEMTENVSQAFLGLSIGCAKCHNHPLEKWTNDQYYAMANLFARVRAKGWGGDTRNGDGVRTLYIAPRGELLQPLNGRPQPPAPLDGTPLDPNWEGDRRGPLADWLTAPENPYFARAIANRVWANFFGVGLVEAVDDMRTSNPASNEPLLAAAAAHLVEQKFDLKALMRAILQSEAYQRTSRPLPENGAEGRFYSRYYPRRLMAEVLLDGIARVTDVPSQFNEILFSGADKQKVDDYPAGTRALQLRDSAVVSRFLKTFGRNEREITCECERSSEPSIVQALHIANGDTILSRLANPKGRLRKMIDEKWSDRRIVEELYLTALSRYPLPEERQALLKELEQVDAKERVAALEDVWWSVLSSREFLFSH